MNLWFSNSSDGLMHEKLEKINSNKWVKVVLIIRSLQNSSVFNKSLFLVNFNFFFSLSLFKTKKNVDKMRLLAHNKFWILEKLSKFITNCFQLRKYFQFPCELKIVKNWWKLKQLFYKFLNIVCRNLDLMGNI